MLKEANKATKFVLPGVPAGGIRTVGQIRGTNTLVLHAGQNGMVVALELLTTHTSGAPVVDDRNEFIRFISEFDVLRALEAGQDLSTLTAEDIMAHDRIAVTSESTIEDAVKMMEEKRLRVIDHRLYCSWDPLRELYPPAHDSVHDTVRGSRRIARAASLQDGAEHDRVDRHHSADWDREEECHYNDRLCAGCGAEGRETSGGGDL